MPQLYSSNIVELSISPMFLYFLFNYKRLVRNTHIFQIYSIQKKGIHLFFPLNKIEIIHMIYNQQQRYKFEQATSRN